MSKQSRYEAIAKAMLDASQEAALVVEACENAHQLSKSEALDVLSGAVVTYLMADGVTRDREEQRVYLNSFIDHLVEYADCTLDLGLDYGEDSN